MRGIRLGAPDRGADGKATEGSAPHLRRAAAFAPGHISGIFEIFDQAPDPYQRGSRGAGICIELGATTAVTIEEADRFQIEVRINGKPEEAAVTRRAVTDVAREAVREGRLATNRDAPAGSRARARLLVESLVDLPSGAGFGMSAAGALSSAMAAAKAWGLGRSVAVRAAHLAEIENRTGLGDVAGAITGGYELRTSAGLPPFGAPRRLLAFGELVLAVVGPPMATSSVLRDPARRAAVQAVGGKFVDELARAPSLENFFELSRRFASESGLLTAEVQRALDLVASVPESRASMSMLGNSIFAHGPSRKIEAVLRAAYPDVWRCSIDAEGARALSVASSPRMPDSTFRRPDGSRPNGRPDPAGD